MFSFSTFAYNTVLTKNYLLSYEQWKVLICIFSFLRRIEKKQWQREFKPHFKVSLSYRNTVRYWGMFSLTDILNITQVTLLYLQMKIWERQKSMKKVKCIHHFILRDKFSMGNLMAGSWKPLTTLNHTSQVARKPLLPSLPLSSHQCQSHLVPDWITGGCMTMAKSLKLDLSCHICPRYYHLTFVRKTPRDWRSLIEGLPHTMYSAYCFNTPHVQAPSRVQCWGIVNSWFILMTIYLLQEVRGSMGGEGVTE